MGKVGNIVRRVRELRWRSRRAWQLLRLYWGTEDCDWATIALLMRHQIRRTREHMQRHDIIADVDRHARQMLIAETLLTRMMDEPYYVFADARHPNGGKHWAAMMGELRRQDDEMLATLLRKHLREWWD